MSSADAPPLPDPGNPIAPWKLQASVHEHHRKPLFCVAFNHADPRNQDLFASVGANRATVYRAKPDGAIEVVQSYADADENEEFFACQWSVSLLQTSADDEDEADGDNQEENDPGEQQQQQQQQQDPQQQQAPPPPQQTPPPPPERQRRPRPAAPPREGRPLLLAAGKNGVVRVIDVLSDALVSSLRGHGRDVHDVAVHPKFPHLALTGGRDHSVRLWNLRAGVCCVVVAGVLAHTNEVFSLSWHPWDPFRFMSSSMDTCVKVWTLRGEPWAAVEASDRWRPGGRAFPAVALRRPVLSASQVHGDYVDCVRWLGDLVLSKSVHGFVALWKPRYGPAMAGGLEGPPEDEEDDDGEGEEGGERDQDAGGERGAAGGGGNDNNISGSGDDGGGGGGGRAGGVADQNGAPPSTRPATATTGAFATAANSLAPTEVLAPADTAGVPLGGSGGGGDEEEEEEEAAGGAAAAAAAAAGAATTSEARRPPSREDAPPVRASTSSPPLGPDAAPAARDKAAAESAAAAARTGGGGGAAAATTGGGGGGGGRQSSAAVGGGSASLPPARRRRPLRPPPVASSDVDGDSGGYRIARLFPIDTGHMWWVRFGLDGRGATLACGGAAGTVHVWDPRQARRTTGGGFGGGGGVGGGGGGGGTAAPKSSVLRTAKGAGGSPSVVRQAAVSLDGSCVIAGCEDGSLWRWGRAYAPGLLPGASPVTALPQSAPARGPAGSRQQTSGGGGGGGAGGGAATSGSGAGGAAAGGGGATTGGGNGVGGGGGDDDDDDRMSE